MWPEMRLSGASGLVSVLSNAWPELARDYVVQGRPIDAWKKTCSWLELSTNPLGIKALMAAHKLIGCESVRPPLSIRDLQGRDKLADILACRAILQAELLSVCVQ